MDCRKPNLLDWLVGLIEFNDIAGISQLHRNEYHQHSLVELYLAHDSGMQFPKFVALYVSEHLK
jgi:hypothetical protein